MCYAIVVLPPHIRLFLISPTTQFSPTFRKRQVKGSNPFGGSFLLTQYTAVAPPHTCTYGGPPNCDSSEANQSHTCAADSSDLYTWKVAGPVITDCPQEGPNVFFWQGCYWMITDTWQGLGVYRSADAEHWQRQANILSGGGQRRDDGAQGQHADVTVQGDRAYVIYFTHPDRDLKKSYGFDEAAPYSDKRTSLQVAELGLLDGNLICDRDKPIDFSLLNIES